MKSLCFYRFYSVHHFQEAHIKLKIDKRIFKKIVSFSGWSLFASSAIALNSQGILVLLNMFFSPAVVAARSLIKLSVFQEMTLNDIYNNTEPAIFIISTPFQALCAISAIKNLHLEKYEVLALLPVKEIRNEQVVSLLKYYQVTFHVQYITRTEEIQLRLLAFLRPCGKYSRVFIGNYNDLNLKLTAFKYIKRGGAIIHLDDGVATVLLLQNKLFSIGFVQKSYLRFLGFCRNVDYKSYLYTIYSDIPNNKYKIKANQLRCLSDAFTKEKEGVYIIGTNTSLYCERQKIPIKSFESYLDSLFLEMQAQYTNERIYYVPHGRDQSDIVRALCDEHKVIYLRPMTCVEVMLLQKKFIPTAIIGFTSTALLNIKNIFPSTLVINILISSKQKGCDYLRLKEISNYYLRHEIQLIEKCLT